MTGEGIPIGVAEIEAAARVIAPHIRRTPVVHSPAINERLGVECVFKMENLQAAGAFKSRGACHVVFSLSNEEAARGVLTHSSGNHAAALARAAQRRGIPCYVVMPKNASTAKVENCRRYRAKITFCEPTLAARESTADELQQSTGATFVHPYDDWRIVAGAATCAREFLEEVPDIDLLVAPVGGGGLLSGTAIAAAAHRHSVTAWGAEPVAADDAWQSMRAGRPVAQWAPTTAADGLRTSLGERPWQVISRHVARIVLASDTHTAHWQELLSRELDAPIEFSSAVPLAALQASRSSIQGRRVGIILSGGNV